MQMWSKEGDLKKKKRKKCASHSPRNLLPIFFPLQTQEPLQPPLTSRSPSLQQRAAGLQRTTSEEREGETEDLNRCKSMKHRKTHPSHPLMGRKTLYLRGRGCGDGCHTAWHTWEGTIRQTNRRSHSSSSALQTIMTCWSCQLLLDAFTLGCCQSPYKRLWLSDGFDTMEDCSHMLLTTYRQNYDV